MKAQAPEHPDTGDLFDRMLEPVRRSVRTLADEVHPLASGWLARTPSLPMVWSLNQLRITEPTTAAAAMALADEHQAELSYRHIEIERDPTEGGLEEVFGAAGWVSDREVYMALGDPPSEPAEAERVVELTEDEALELMGMWIVEDHPGISEDSASQLLESSRREGRLWRERCFGIRARDGAPLSMTKLRTEGTLAWVEDVFTAPGARHRGHARLLVSHVTALAAARGPHLTMIIADDNDWPKELYAKVGFRPVGRTRTFHLDLPRS